MAAQGNNLISQYSGIGKLILISTPIGDFSDLTLLALKKLNEAEYIICEDYKITKRLLKFFEVNKELLLLNEHSNEDDINSYTDLLLQGKILALVSDCGTPVFADPGLNLLNKCIYYKIPYEFINGSNSVLASIVISGFDISRFYYYGFLSPKKEIRVKELNNINSLDYPVILMDTPYRLYQLMEDVNKNMPDKNLCLAMNLCTQSELILYGKPQNILNQLSEKFTDNIKPEFVLIIDK